MKRLGHGPEDFITPIVRSVMDSHTEAKQRDFARHIECSESRISQIKKGTSQLSGAELYAFCDFYDTHRPIDAIEDRLGREAHEMQPARTVLPTTLRSLSALAMRDVAEMVLETDRILQSGAVEPDEEASLEAMDHTIATIIDTLKAVRARLPKLPRAPGGES